MADPFPVPALPPGARLAELPARTLRDAATGGAARLPTRLRLAHRGGILLVRFDCRHRGITATMRRDNDALWKEDVVEVFWTAGDPARGYRELEVNPLGTKFAADVAWAPESGAAPTEGRGRRAGMSVETIPTTCFRASMRVRPGRWSALLRVPLSGGEFRANFFRVDRAAGEFQALFPTMREPPDFHVPEKLGKFRLA